LFDSLFCEGELRMYMILGLALCALSLAWIKFSPYYSYAGWLLTLLGVYFIFKGREKIGLKNK
jgi:hypothetical protein